MRTTFEDSVLDTLRAREELTAQEIATLLHQKHSGRVQVALGALIVKRRVQRVAGSQRYRLTASNASIAREQNYS